MAKLRVHELARELGVSSKEIIDRLGDLGVEVKSHASTLDADAIGKLRGALNGPRTSSARRPGPASTTPPAAGAAGSDGAAPGRRQAQSQPAATHAPRPAPSQPAAPAPRPAQSQPAATHAPRPAPSQPAAPAPRPAQSQPPATHAPRPAPSHPAA